MRLDVALVLAVILTLAGCPARTHATPAAVPIPSGGVRGAAVPIPSGIVDPPPHYQRYRRDEYPKALPFFQWWYFWVKDVASDEHYAFAYSMTSENNERAQPSARAADAPPVPETGGYGLFAHVADGKHFAKTVQFPLDDLHVDNLFDFNINKANSGNASACFLTMEQQGDHGVLLQGSMPGSQHVWYSSGGDPSTSVSWKLNFTRVRGFYGQPEFELPDKLFPVIMWNTWAHLATVTGTIMVGGKQVTVDGSFRAYGDMNWGTGFPEPPPSEPDNYEEYHWGWYALSSLTDVFARDTRLASHLDEMSLIVGIGRTWAGFPFEEMAAQFGDIELGDSCTLMDHCSTRAVKIAIDKSTKYPLPFEGTNDGAVRAFSANQSAWTNFTDDFGTARLPLSQTVILETDHVRVEMVFASSPSQYVRLLFPHKDSLFSDFEALGTEVDLTLWLRAAKDAPWALHTNTTLPGGGLEFGYHVPATEAAAGLARAHSRAQQWAPAHAIEQK